MSGPTNTFGTTGTNDFNSTSHTGTGTGTGPHIGSTGTHDPITGAARELAAAGHNATNPTHHVHSDNEPLPGARGGAQTVDYTPEHMKSARAQDLDIMSDNTPRHRDNHGAATGLGAPGGISATAHDATHGSHQHNLTHDHPHGTHDQSHGAHAHDQSLGTHSVNHPAHSQTHAHDQHAASQTAAQHVDGKKPGIGDKIIGKTEEIAGKVTGKPALVEKGAVRATVGKQ